MSPDTNAQSHIGVLGGAVKSETPIPISTPTFTRTITSKMAAPSASYLDYWLAFPISSTTFQLPSFCFFQMLVYLP
jgi:hypothetical protein